MDTPQFNIPTSLCINPSEARTSAIGRLEAKFLNNSTATSRLWTVEAKSQEFFKHAIPPSLTTTSFKASSSEIKLDNHRRSSFYAFSTHKFRNLALPSSFYFLSSPSFSISFFSSLLPSQIQIWPSPLTSKRLETNPDLDSKIALAMTFSDDWFGILFYFFWWWRFQI